MEKIEQLDIYGRPITKKEELIGLIITFIFLALVSSPFIFIAKHIKIAHDCLSKGIVKQSDGMHRNQILYITEDGRRFRSIELYQNGQQACMEWTGRLEWK